jgi:hypothetical protein
MHTDERGHDMTKLRTLIARFDRWTIVAFNPQYPLAPR